MQLTSPITPDVNLIGRASFAMTTTVTAHQNGQPSGTLVLSEVAEMGVVDLNAANAVVDQAAGTIRLTSGSPLVGGQPITVVTLQEATGVFKEVRQVGPWAGYYAGYYLMPLDDSVGLQQNILEGAFIGGSFESAHLGRVAIVPEPASCVLALLVSIGILLALRRAKAAYQ